MSRDQAPGRWVWTLLMALMACIAAAPAVAQSLDESQAEVGPAAVPLFSPSSPSLTVAPMLATDRARALDCMSWAIAYEAAGQPIAGQEAVGQVILNRVRNPHRPKTVCGVVFEGSERRTGCQFTFTCDGSLHRRLSEETMLTARSVASAVLDGAAPDHVGGATHYHANYVSPVWATTGRRVTQIGAHIFYEMPGDAGHSPLPVATVGEPAIAAAIPAPLPGSGAPRRMGRHARAVGYAQQAVVPAAAHSMFQPWGLPVAAQPQQ